MTKAQSQPAVHFAADGTALTAWRESGEGSDQLLVQRYAFPSSHPTFPILVSDESVGTAQLSLAADDGNYGWVLAWNRFELEGGNFTIRARDFDPQDQARDVEYQVNTLDGHHWFADVALSPLQRRAFVWEGRVPGGEPAIYARVFSQDANMIEEAQLNVEPIRGADAPQVVYLGNVDFLAAWSGTSEGGTSSEILVRRFDYFGNTLSEPVRISDPGGDNEGEPRLARDAIGNLVVAWNVESGATRLRRLDPQGRPVGAVIEAAREPGEAQMQPAVAMDLEGNIALGYTAYNTDGDPQLNAWMQRFDVDDVAAPRQRVSGDPARQSLIDMSSDVDGDVFAVWETQDGNEVPRVRLQHVRGDNVADLSLTFTDNAVSVGHGGMQAYQARVRHEGQSTGIPGEGDTTQFAVNIELAPRATVHYVNALDWACSESESYFVITVHCRYGRVLAPGQEAYPIVIFAFTPPYLVNAQATASVFALRHPDPNASNDTAIDETYIGDVEPEAFSLRDLVDVPIHSWQTSDPVSVSGIDVPVAISVSNGEYSISGGPWTSEPGQVMSGNSIRVRHETPWTFSTKTPTYLYVGEYMERFETTTVARDIVPNPFTFIDITNATLGQTATSQLITISGINDATPISVSGGSFSINGGTWRTHSGHAYAGDTVRVQHVAASTFGTRTNTVLTVGNVSGTFSSTTVARDVTPDAFAFAAQNDVARGSERTSNEVVLAGMNDAASIAVAGGSYSIDGGAFTSAPGSISSGQRLRLRHTAASGFATTTITTITVGTTQVTFSSTTEAQDAVPSAFAFVDRAGLATAVEVTSDPITVAGINVAASISVANGSYSINGGAFTSTAGSVVAGDQVRVRHVSSSSANSAVSTTLTIGGVSDAFTSTTGASDTTPAAYAFADVTGAKRNKAVTSAAVTVSGINAPVAISVSGGGARWSKNGGAFATAAGTVVAGDVVRLQLTAPNASNVTVSVQVTIGGVSDTWSVTTGN